ncbi:MAG: Multiple RNA-binding domain-containing protein 1 [Piccolia ochrophora]|nr:MAG: Multiple RNA-binding domain-containing protein 1 [Piccolia ochrophora]
MYEEPSVASSRIFVRGLPPSMTEREFRTHFSRFRSVTDAKLISHRRIGYVGYKSAIDADQSVKDFNKTFFRMSKINVEIARPVSDDTGAPNDRTWRLILLQIVHSEAPPVQDARAGPTAPTHTATSNLKRKWEDRLTGKQDDKLQEYLNTMQVSSKTKTWGDEKMAVSGDDRSSQQPETQSVRADKKQDRSLDLTQSFENATHENFDRIIDHNAAIEANSILVDTSDPQIDQSASVLKEPPGSLSDADWLRSRTSRTLGLETESTNSVPSEGATRAKNSRSDLKDTSQSNMTIDTVVYPKSSIQETLSNGDCLSPSDTSVDAIMATGRLFIRNLSYASTEEDIKNTFALFGNLKEVHVPTDVNGQCKGFAFVEYQEPSSAIEAYSKLDSTTFQGRLLHVLPATAKRDGGLDEFEISKLPLKKQKYIKRKAGATSSTFNWNAMYMNADAVLSSISNRLGVSKSDLLDPTSTDAAVKLAHAETHVIQETKAYFNANGVDLDAFKQRERGDSSILVKNFPYGTTLEELRRLFEDSGEVSRILMPPAGIIAIVTFAHPTSARAAFTKNAYRRFKESILFLEKAPKNLFVMEHVGNTIESSSILARESKPEPGESAHGHLEQDASPSGTIFVKNLNFSTSSNRLAEVFRPLEGFLSARVKTKPDPKISGQTLSMGFGFVEFRTRDSAKNALLAMQDFDLDGHRLLLRSSHKSIDAAEERRAEDRAKNIAARKTKIIIKNLPFEATKKDVRALFGVYGQLRSVRVPKKFNSSARGFAFADFVTAREAENAMESLRNTHLLGRRLVLEFTEDEPQDAEGEILKMQEKVGKQADKVALRKLTGSGRKKFDLEEGSGGE